jgi:5-methylcytosine-specific restriction endonuclease McrA
MPTVDLFGNITPDKTKEQEYKEYINSAEWKRKSKEAIKRAGNKCQKCGMDKGTRRLDAHHLTYDNFKHERPEDLEVVCVKCHREADKEREQEVAERNYEKLEDARFEGWARAKYGDNWMLYNDECIVYDEYREWFERNDF